MPENKKNINIALVNFPEVPEELSQTIADTFNDTTTPARQQVGFALGDLTYMAFGALNHHANKKKIDRSIDLQYHKQRQEIISQNNIKQFLSEISDNIKSIPDEKLCNPKLDIVGPALEASKYYTSNEEIRKMFSNLIAASMNTDTSETVHHSFVEIIKQLSPLDASNLALINSSNECPIAEYRMMNKSGSHVRLQTHVFLDSTIQQNIKTQATSLSNLFRLGLINIDYSMHLIDDDKYSKFFSEPTFVKFKSDLDVSLALNPDYKYSSINIQKGLIAITPLGKDFSNICI